MTRSTERAGAMNTMQGGDGSNVGHPISLSQCHHENQGELPGQCVAQLGPEVHSSMQASNPKGMLPVQRKLLGASEPRPAMGQQSLATSSGSTARCARMGRAFQLECTTGRPRGNAASPPVETVLTQSQIPG